MFRRYVSIFSAIHGKPPVQLGALKPAATKLDAFGPTALEALTRQFGAPHYHPDFKTSPLDSTILERGDVVQDVKDKIKFLNLNDADKPKPRTSEGREHYPLLAVNARAGAGKTLILKMVGSALRKDGYVAIFLSLGNSTEVTADETSRGAEWALVVRILFTLFHRATTWEKFQDYCSRYRQVPKIEAAADWVRTVAKKPTAPCMLLVDEGAAAVGKPAGKRFSRDVLSVLGQVQQNTTTMHKQTKSAPMPVYALVTSLRYDVVKAAQTSSKRPVVFVECKPLSEKAQQHLIKKWSSELHKKHHKVHSREKCRQYVTTYVKYCGGLPRALEWADKEIFGKPGQFELTEEYDSEPSWECVEASLTCQPVSATAPWVNVGMSQNGLLLEKLGNDLVVVSLPPFQIHSWMQRVGKHSTKEEQYAAYILRCLVPIRPPTDLGSVELTGGQRLRFEDISQAYEMICHRLKCKPIPIGQFPVPGTTHNLPEDAMVSLVPFKERYTKLFSYPEGLATMRADERKSYDKGKLLMVPQNPSNPAVDHGCRIKVNGEWVHQLTQNKFTATVNVANVARRIHKTLPITQQKLAVIYCQKEAPKRPKRPPAKGPKGRCKGRRAKSKLPTIVVWRDGSMRLLSHLVELSLDFQPKKQRPRATKGRRRGRRSA